MSDTLESKLIRFFNVQLKITECKGTKTQGILWQKFPKVKSSMKSKWKCFATDGLMKKLQIILPAKF